ncbi:MAG TPA: hypothetical protein VGO40_22210 [Longimicrobium sp.]|jgi:hypothetical protein|nr:hypothetical protein [Longimicrobium sp.]
MRDRLKILGWLYAASGAVILLLATVIGTIFGVAGVAASSALGVFGFVVAIFVAAIALPSLVCGWGLLNYKPWARVLGIILSVLQLANFPVGTAIGGYGLWVLLNDESQRLLEAGDPRYRQVGAGW